jgi:phage gp36-like protein
MYLTEIDLKKGIYAETLAVLTRDDPNTVNQAIGEAVEEVRGYLCARYDIDSEFRKSGEERNVRVVNLVREIAVYNCYKISNMANMPDTRQQIYKDTIQSLIRIQEEKESIPGLGRLSSTSGGSNYIAFGGNKPRNNKW